MKKFDRTGTRRALNAVAAAAAIVLAISGCAAGAPGPTAGTTAGATSTSLEVVYDGAAITATSVSDNFGAEPEVTLPDAALVGDKIERRTIVEGAGEQINADSTVVMKLLVVDLGTGQSAQPYGYLGANVGLDDPQLPGYVAAMVNGVPSGSRVAAIVPGEVLLGGATTETEVPASLFVIDVQSIAPAAAATGSPVSATQDLVVVSQTPGKQPEITVNTSPEAPAEQVIDVVLQGDGATVKEGDLVTVQYSGLLLSDGTEFDSSWSRGGMPSSFPTTGVVPGFANALVGQQVGSRVVTVFGPDLGYGENGTGSIPAGSTLVFVVDIIDTM